MGVIKETTGYDKEYIMKKITEAQFAVLANIHAGKSELRFAPKKVAAQLVTLGYVNEGGKVTGTGESLINDVHDNLANGRLDMIDEKVKNAIIREDLFTEGERRALLHDDTETVRMLALMSMNVTMDDCVRYADENDTSARGRVIALTYMRSITPEQLALFTGFTDEDTIKAVLCRVTMRHDILADVITPTVIDRWIDGNATDSRELLMALVRTAVPLTSAQFERLYVPDDVNVVNQVLGTPSRPAYQDLLTLAEREALVASPNEDIRYEAASRLNGLTVNQLRRLAGDASDIVRAAIMTRLRPLAEALRLVDPSAAITTDDVNAIIGDGMLD